MDYLSTPAQVAEEINGFSALSGPVSVAGEATTAVVTVVTRANGWSIESPIDFGIGGLHTMQAGGIINITAAETCTFQEGGTASAGYYCYDGVCGAKSTDGAAGNHESALQGIKDDNGDAILGTATVAVASNAFTVTMPLGKSCDGLELRGTTAAITKTVNKHNNGKSFKITRSFLKSAIVTGTAFDGTTDGANKPGEVALAAGEGDQLLPTVDSLVISGTS